MLHLAPAPLRGAFVVTPSRLEDERGIFGRLFDAEIFAASGLDPTMSQTSFSFNRLAGTLRGLHYQTEPWAEAKLVRCTRGRVYDVIVDLRERSETRHQWFGVELSDELRNAVYIPRGFAHGFVTLTTSTELHYQMSAPYHPESTRGVRWDDPALAIDWPVTPTVIAPRDASFPLLPQ